jgi:hypothetical protein
LNWRRPPICLVKRSTTAFAGAASAASRHADAQLLHVPTINPSKPVHISQTH